jgi:chromosome segregation ATPase
LEKRPESFENMADVFKMSLGQMEKRFVELEEAISALSDKLKEIKPEALTSVQQRVDDIEDLAMLEQVGVIEIKKMLESVDQKFQEISDNPSREEVERKIKEIEDKVVAASATKVAPEIRQKLDKLEEEVKHLSELPEPQVDLADVRKIVDELKTSISATKEYSESAIKNLNARIDNLPLSPQSSSDFDFLKSKIESLQSAIDMFSDKNVENDMRVSDLRERLELVNESVKESASQKVIDEVKDTRRNVTLTSVRLDTAEKVIKSLTDNLVEVERTAKKFEGFEKLSNLNRDVEEKLEKFRLMEGEIQRLTNHVEMIYSSIEGKLNKLETTGEEIENINKDIGDMKIEADKLKVDMMDFVKSEELEKRISERMGALEVSSGSILSSVSKFDNRLGSLEESQAEDFRRLETISKGLNHLASVSVIKGELEKRFDEKMKGSGPDAQKVFKSINDIKSRLGHLENSVKSISGAKDTRTVEDINMILSNLDERLASLETNVVQLTDPAALIETQVSEFVNRFIFLESRLAAIETSMQKMTNVQPIILE